jgi:hypothetical protein
MRKLALAMALATGLGGCVATYTEQPGGGFAPTQVVVQTPGGLYPIYAPPAVPAVEPDLAAPPGLRGPTGPNLPPPGGHWEDGTYDGTATLLENDGDCAFRFAMTNMHVKNGHVRFAGFHGTIGPDGGVRMPDGGYNWITGHFGGSHFSGFYSNRYCAFTLSLDRVGP